jgi:uncharacterized DUF497 family protein
MNIFVTWDAPKASANLRKHGVSFEEAATVFADPLAKITDDPEHSEEEARELILGSSEKGRLLVVSFVQRMSAIRLISARPASRTERHVYQES